MPPVLDTVRGALQAEGFAGRRNPRPSAVSVEPRSLAVLLCHRATDFVQVRCHRRSPKEWLKKALLAPRVEGFTVHSRALRECSKRAVGLTSLGCCGYFGGLWTKACSRRACVAKIALRTDANATLIATNHSSTCRKACGLMTASYWCLANHRSHDVRCRPNLGISSPCLYPLISSFSRYSIALDWTPQKLNLYSLGTFQHSGFGHARSHANAT